MSKHWQAVGLTVALLTRFLIRDCSTPDAWVYVVCAVMIGACALQNASSPAQTEIPCKTAFDVDGADLSELKTDVEELKTRVNGMVLRDGLKL